MSRGHVLVARLDSLGDVLLAGPAVRAVAAGAERVTALVSSRGEPAARLLPGVDEVVVFDAPWILADPEPLDPAAVEALVARLAQLRLDAAVVMTSFHQSPLPLALLLRLAGVGFVGAVCDDFPGSLLDVRHRVPDELHEVERGLSLAEACGFSLPAGDDACLRVDGVDPGAPVLDGAACVDGGRPGDGTGGGLGLGLGGLGLAGLGGLGGLGAGPYVVVHPGASVPARTWPPERFAAAARALAAAGLGVVVTGSAGERALVERIRGQAAGAGAGAGAGQVVALCGLPLPAFARLLAGADAVVVGNTGPAHLAAAVGTAVVSLYPPTVPAARWRPWGVPHVLLGDQRVACAGCRARTCPFGAAQPCLAGVEPADVVGAVERVRRESGRGHLAVASVAAGSAVAAAAGVRGVAAGSAVAAASGGAGAGGGER